ncbi:hypothetical protein [Moorena sp. SIO3H5]|uniref:hypothetical protein n=1 Tax=Moorena sp. SIO3H5 TaxID=2607834 RepID=UPI0013BD557C|nr:hypothetical protein [Moorena sp. SIO3H5]NEO73371.1 hypothetical protein [Moorena sp. SIO3H5]
MFSTNRVSDIDQSVNRSTSQGNTVLRILEKNYRNNLDSDYTERIEKLDKNFKYSSNSNHYWSEPELSLLYGTPLYEAASPSQKIALNHLFWVVVYKTIADSEVEITHYNLITAGSLTAMGADYETIAHQLEHETDQERSHIHAFYKVSYQTQKALLGKQAFIDSLNKKSSKHNWGSLEFANYQSFVLEFIPKMMLKGKEQYNSPYLRKFSEENKPISTSTNGFFNGLRVNLPQSLPQFFAFNWGSSPFLACNYYTVRYLANLALKNYEHKIHMYCKKLHKQNQFVPVPTTISHYHFLDEAFHTTTSLFLARDLHKHLPESGAYEKFVANVKVYMTQCQNLSQLSGVLPNSFIGVSSFLMVYIYKLLQSPLFGMSAVEALHWMEKCLCHEHDGFHVNLKFHQRLLSDIRNFAAQIDYLWPVNREMRLMASGASIDRAISKNAKAFKEFSRSVSRYQA